METMIINRKLANFGIKFIVEKRIMWLMIIGAGLILATVSGWFDFSADKPFILALLFLAGILISDMSQFINHFRFHFSRKGDRYSALHYALSQFSWNSLITAIATSLVGFGISLISETEAIEYIGLVCGIGVILTFLLVSLLLPIGLSFGSPMKERIGKRPVSGLRIIKFAHWIIRHKTIIVAVSIVGFVLVSYRFIRIEFKPEYSKLISGPFTSFAFSFASIAMILGVYLKSFRAGLLAMWFNLFPLMVVIVCLDLLADISYRVTVISMLMISGMAVNTSIRFLHHFHNELIGFREYDKAVQQTFMKSGNAFLLTFVTLSLGYGSLLFFNEINFTQTGTLLLIGILTIAIDIFFFLPSILIYIRPFKTETLLPQISI